VDHYVDENISLSHLKTKTNSLWLLSPSRGNEGASPDRTIISHSRAYNMWSPDVCRL